jgi:hypothetical protein
MGWSGVENGALLMRAAADGFDAFVTKDANLQYQQNLQDLPLAVVVVHAQSNTIEDIRAVIPALLTALASLAQRRLIVVSGP